MSQLSIGTQKDNTHKLTTYIFLLITTSLWGSAFVVSKIVENEVLPPVAAFLRFGLAAVFAFTLLVFFRFRNKSVKLVPSGNLSSIVILGLTGVAAYNLFFFWGLSFSRSSDGSMIIPALSPAFTVVLGALFFHERFLRKHAIGLSLTLIGTAIFFSSIAFVGGTKPDRMIGDGLFLLAAVCWALYTLRGKKVLQTVDPLLATAYAMIIGSIVLLAFAIPDIVKTNWGTLSLRFWLDMIYLALFPSVLANWFYYLGVKNIGPSRSSVFMYFVPVSGLILSSILLGDILTSVQFIGSAIMIIGVWVVNRQSKPKFSMVRNHEKSRFS